MFTIERHNKTVYFELHGKMITKLPQKGWVTLQGEKVCRNEINNLVNSKTSLKRAEVAGLKSVLNRFFGGEYKFN